LETQTVIVVGESVEGEAVGDTVGETVLERA
jgi:hypothetical protein